MKNDTNQVATARQSCSKPSEYETSFEAYAVEMCPMANVACSQRNISEMERLLSLALGTAFATRGLGRGRLAGIGLISLGAVLIHRGVTGHCHGYQLFGINTAS